MMRLAGLVSIAALLAMGGWAISTAESGQDTLSAHGVQAAKLDRAGEDVYRELCAVCHGDNGRGDGPLAFGMRPTVIDLRFHMAEGHTDDDLYGWISDGLPGVPLHTYRSELSEQERWDVINFIRASYTN
jgi:mono/diheme cytochrome c family protein